MSSPVILWVEDDDNDVLLMERALRRAGIVSNFLRVIDGVQATEYLAGEGAYSDRTKFPLPQLLLLDIKTPRMSGFDVLQWKQSRPELQGLPAVMLSSSTELQDQKEASRLGAKGYFVKPSTFDGLVRQVEALATELAAA